MTVGLQAIMTFASRRLRPELRLTCVRGVYRGAAFTAQWSREMAFDQGDVGPLGSLGYRFQTNARSLNLAACSFRPVPSTLQRTPVKDNCGPLISAMSGEAIQFTCLSVESSVVIIGLWIVGL